MFIRKFKFLLCFLLFIVHDFVLLSAFARTTLQDNLMLGNPSHNKVLTSKELLIQRDQYSLLYSDELKIP
jgi:hypothetical protein